ncbi:MAG: diaminopimelate epimerase [Actinobacteria bacterium]|nr:diaminopimelate epimerase [Actinomycetota bacterium]MCL6104326.1 diaminopimelate epimerase [Actinomycetota bacterium]
MKDDENFHGKMIHLTKHHGLGNDFLVLIDLEDRLHLSTDQISILCDRHMGVGADGLIRVLKGDGYSNRQVQGDSIEGGEAGQSTRVIEDAKVAMCLYNADGKEAEISGNGLACLAQAVLDAGLVSPSEFLVTTAAGVRKVSAKPSDTPFEYRVKLQMGEVSLQDMPELVNPLGAALADQPDCIEILQFCRADVGNPHLIALTKDARGINLLSDTMIVLRLLDAKGIDRQVNLEFISIGEKSDEIEMKVFERGVGESLACGTGSCAAAAAAHMWGHVGTDVVVNNPGGVLHVELTPLPSQGGATAARVFQAVLDTTAKKVADIEVDPNALKRFGVRSFGQGVL